MEKGTSGDLDSGMGRSQYGTERGADGATSGALRQDQNGTNNVTDGSFVKASGSGASGEPLQGRRDNLTERAAK